MGSLLFIAELTIGARVRMATWGCVVFVALTTGAARAGEPPTARIMVNPVPAKVGPPYPPLADGGPNIVGNELRLDAGGVRVWVEVQLADWDPNGDGSPPAGDLFVTLDGSGLLDADTDGDGLVTDDGDQEDILHPTISCDSHSDCNAAFGEIASDPCLLDETCNPVYSDKGFRPDSWCYQNCAGVISATTGSGWLVRIYTQDARPGDGTVRWAATAVYDVPPSAKGKYSVQLDTDHTFLEAATSPYGEISSLSETGFGINILTGRCCFGSGTPNEGCIDAITSAECDTQPPPVLFTAETRCSPDGPGCEPVTGACCDGDPFAPCGDDALASDCACLRCNWYGFQRCADVECAPSPIPAVSDWGLAVLSLLLMIGAKVQFAVPVGVAVVQGSFVSFC